MTGIGTTQVTYAGLNKTVTLPANDDQYVQTTTERMLGSGSSGDYSVFNERRINGCLYKAGYQNGLHFSFDKFEAAVIKAGNNGAAIDARDYTWSVGRE